MKVSFKYLHCIYASESVQVQMSLCCLPKQVAQAAVKVHSVWRLPSAMALNMSRWASFSERRWSITPPATENGVWLPGSSPMGNWHHRYVLYIKTVCKGKKNHTGNWICFERVHIFPLSCNVIYIILFILFFEITIEIAH